MKIIRNNNFYLLLNGLLVVVELKFQNTWKKCEKKNWMFFWSGFARLPKKKDGTLSVYKRSSMKSIWEPLLIVSFPSLPLNKPFSVIFDSAFTEANKALEHLQKTSKKKTVIIPGELEPRNGKKPTSSEQMKKLFDRGQWARTCREQKSCTTTVDDLVLPVSFSADEDETTNASYNANNSVLAKIHEGVEYFERNRSRLESLPATNEESSRWPRRFWRWIRR